MKYVTRERCQHTLQSLKELIKLAIHSVTRTQILQAFNTTFRYVYLYSSLDPQEAATTEKVRKVKCKRLRRFLRKNETIYSDTTSQEVEEAKRSYLKYLSQVFSKHRSHSATLDQQCESVHFFDPLCVPKNASLNNDNESVAGPALANPIYFTAAAKPRFCSMAILP